MNELIIFGVPVPIATVVSIVIAYIGLKVFKAVTKWVFMIALLAFVATYVLSSAGFSQLFP